VGEGAPRTDVSAVGEGAPRTDVYALRVPLGTFLGTLCATHPVSGRGGL